MLEQGTAKDLEWLQTHYGKLQRKYPNMYVAVRNGKVIAANKEFGKVYDIAKKKAGNSFAAGYILAGEPFVLKADLSCSDGKV